MKTIEELSIAADQYNANVDAQIANLIRMKDEYKRLSDVAKTLIPDLVPVLAKLHLTIEWFTKNSPDPKTPSNTNYLHLHLVSDGKFRFLKFQGYSKRGGDKNIDRLVDKKDTLCAKVVTDESLLAKYPGISCDINPYSLEIDEDRDPLNKSVLMDIGYRF